MLLKANAKNWSNRATRGRALLLGLVLLICSCRGGLNGDAAATLTGSPAPGGLTPSQEVAAEALSYMLQVVVGQAGFPGNRAAWRSSGVDADLDFKAVAEVMTSPERTKGGLMVLDTRIMGLSEVLFHYNPRFNLFKGMSLYESPYPSAELVAVRLLLVRKLARGEAVDFKALQALEPLLVDGGVQPAPADLESANLSAPEFALLRDIFRSEPLFALYYKHPFIVDAMTQIGFYRRQRETDALRRKASYKEYALPRPGGAGGPRQVRIAVLPSLMRDFESGGGRSGFRPTEALQKAFEESRSHILEQIAAALRAAEPRMPSDLEAGCLSRVSVTAFDRWPLCLYPENARRVVADVCPWADLVVVILGKNVYRSMDLGGGRAQFPNTRLIYLDIEDAQQGQVDYQLAPAAEAIGRQLLESR